MRAFTTHTGLAAPLLRPNIDTDLIIPLNRGARGIELSEGQMVFESIRYLPDGSENPEFILNQLPYRRASILLAGENFGTGSSRESAVTGLMDFGFSAIIAPSFGQIFYNNCFGNGLMPVVLAPNQIRQLAEQIAFNPLVAVTVDLEEMEVRHPELRPILFSVEVRLRNKMLAGLEDIDEILKYTEGTELFESSDLERRPWIYDWR